MVGFEVPAGSYWVQIEGEDGEEGDFELLVLCDEHSALHPTAIPTPVPPVPTMEPTWDCASRVYTDVTNSSSNVSCATYVDKVLYGVECVNLQRSSILVNFRRTIAEWSIIIKILI